MTDAETLAILQFLEETRTLGLSALGVETRDPVWMMTIALLLRHYQKRRITISSLANASGVAYTTSLRHIDQMVKSDLLVRTQDPSAAKLVFIEPTDTLLKNFNHYCLSVKNQIGSSLGLGPQSDRDFVFGGAHLAANIIPNPAVSAPNLQIDGPLRFLVKDDPTFLVLVRLQSELSVFLDTPVEFDVLEYDELHARIIENGSAKCSSYDIVSVDMPWLGRMARDQSLLPLNDMLKLSKLNPFDYYAAAWEGGMCLGQQLGIPFAPTAELLLYREDIFAKHQLRPPTTVHDVLEAARRIHNTKSGMYGISWNAASGQPLGQSFIQIMAAFGSPPVSLQHIGAGYDLSTPWKELYPTLNNDAGKETLEYLIELANYSPPSISTMDWSARLEAYRSGVTGMSYEWSSRTAYFEDDRLSPARGNTGYLPHPSSRPETRISPMGGYVLAIPANLAHERMRPAWRLLRWLVAPEFSKLLIQNGSPANFLHSVSADPEVAGLAPVLNVLHSMERLGELQLWPRPPIPFMTTMMRIVGEEVHKVIWGGRPARHALPRVEDRLNSLFDELRKNPENNQK